MSTPLNRDQVLSLLETKQNRTRKGTPAPPLPERKFNGLRAIYNHEDKLWEVKDGWKVLAIKPTEVECREERDRLEDERS